MFDFFLFFLSFLLFKPIKPLLLFFFIIMLIDWLLCPLKLYMNWTPEWQKMNDCCFQNTKKETAVLQWMSYFTAACSFIDYPKNTTGRSHVMRREEYPSSAGVSSSGERTTPVHVVTATKQKKEHTPTRWDLQFDWTRGGDRLTDRRCCAQTDAEAVCFSPTGA